METWDERLTRIKHGLNKINQLMSEVNRMSNTNQNESNVVELAQWLEENRSKESGSNSSAPDWLRTIEENRAKERQHAAERIKNTQRLADSLRKK